MSPQSPRWSETAWKAVEDVYEAILRQPFVRELMQGTLPREKFLFYLGQDAHYLASYCRSLAHTASRLTDNRHVNAFLKFASDGIAVEKALHESFLNGEPLPPVSPTCAFYTSVETAAAMRPVEVEAAALLPCFWVYQRVGEHILANCRDLAANPYARWIETYGDQSFAEATRLAINICDTLADNCSDEIREEMTAIFKTCTRLEWMFWDSAYNLETWKI